MKRFNEKDLTANSPRNPGIARPMIAGVVALTVCVMGGAALAADWNWNTGTGYYNNGYRYGTGTNYVTPYRGYYNNKNSNDNWFYDSYNYGNRYKPNTTWGTGNGYGYQPYSNGNYRFNNNFTNGSYGNQQFGRNGIYRGYGHNK